MFGLAIQFWWLLVLIFGAAGAGIYIFFRALGSGIKSIFTRKGK